MRIRPFISAVSTDFPHIRGLPKFVGIPFFFLFFFVALFCHFLQSGKAAVAARLDKGRWTTAT
jgi:hypothetical protein